MSLSTRVGLQWEDKQLQEPTDTYVVTSSEKYFVDIRLRKNDNYHDIPFEWAFCGVAQSVEHGSTSDKSIVSYTHDIDSRYIAARVANQENPEQFLSPDTGKFESADSNGIERETGQMLNPDSGRFESYVELWQHLNPINGSPINPHKRGQEFEIIVLSTVPGQRFIGKIIQVGNFIQGIASLVPVKGKGHLSEVLSLVRAKRGNCTEMFQITFEWGDNRHVLPINFGGKKGDIISHNDVKWTVLEQGNGGI